jgi:hypothetical protein
LQLKTEQKQMEDDISKSNAGPKTTCHPTQLPPVPPPPPPLLLIEKKLSCNDSEKQFWMVKHL